VVIDHSLRVGGVVRAPAGKLWRRRDRRAGSVTHGPDRDRRGSKTTVGRGL